MSSSFFIISGGRCEVRVRRQLQHEFDDSVALSASNASGSRGRGGDGLPAEEVVVAVLARLSTSATRSFTANHETQPSALEEVEPLALSKTDFVASEKLQLSLVLEQVPLLADLEANERESLMALLSLCRSGW